MSATLQKNNNDSISSQDTLNSITQEYFINSTKDYLSQKLTSLFEEQEQNCENDKDNKKDFDSKLKEFINIILPDIHKLLKGLKIKNGENVIMDELERYLIKSGGEKNSSKVNDWQKKINKTQLSIFQVVLNLEKIFLLVSSLNLNSIGNSNDRTQIDLLEKRVTKEKQKTIKSIKKWLSLLQLEFSMMKMDDLDKLEVLCSQEVYIDADTKFQKLISEFIINPFGKLLNQDLLELFTKMDFNEKIIKELKQVIESEKRKNHRKPQTPSKIQKEQVNPHNNSQQTRHFSGKRSVTKGLNHFDSQVQTDISLTLLGKRQPSQCSQTLYTQEIAKVLHSNSTQLSNRASRILTSSAQIIRQTSQQQSQPVQSEDQQYYSNNIVQIRGSQSLYEDQSQIDLISKSLHSTQFNTMNHNDGGITSSNEQQQNDKIAFIDSYDLGDLQNIIQTQVNENNRMNSELKTQSVTFTQKKSSKDMVKFQPIANGQQFQKRRLISQQTSYMTKRPKSKDLNNGGFGGFIIKDNKDNKFSNKSKGGIASLVSQISKESQVSKMIYTRIKASNANSKNATPQQQEEKTIQPNLIGNISKRLSFKESQEEQIENDDDDEIQDIVMKNPESNSQKENSEYNLLFSSKQLNKRITGI